MRHELPEGESNWNCGIWLGKCTQSDGHYIGNPEGVIWTKGVKRRPKSESDPIDDLKKAVAPP